MGSHGGAGAAAEEGTKGYRSICGILRFPENSDPNPGIEALRPYNLKCAQGLLLERERFARFVEEAICWLRVLVLSENN